MHCMNTGRLSFIRVLLSHGARETSGYRVALLRIVCNHSKTYNAACDMLKMTIAYDSGCDAKVADHKLIAEFGCWNSPGTVGPMLQGGAL